MAMSRRAVLKGGLACLGAVTAGFPFPTRAQTHQDVGYYTASRNGKAPFMHGRALWLDPAYRAAVPAGWDGETSLVIRVADDGRSVQHRLFPVEWGHSVAVSPDRRRAVLTGQNGRHICSFDTRTLDIDRHVPAHGEDAVAGGHAVFVPDGPLVVAERRAYMPYEGSPERHFGHITVRDPETLAVLEAYSAHGIAPHEINLLEDGHHLAIANYGTTLRAETDPEGYKLSLIQPSLTVIDIRDGRLTYRWVPDPLEFEIRHLAARRPDRVFAIQNRRKPFAEIQALMTERTAAYLPHVGKDGRAHAPAPVLRFDLASDRAPSECVPDDGLAEMGRGQSITYDAVHDEAIGTFKVSNRLIVFDGRTGLVKRVIRTDRLGLFNPAGVDLHPDGAHYVVSGDLQFHYVFRRGSHEVVRDRCVYETLFGHSHLTVA